MNATQTLKQEIEKFRKSNSFTPGDPTSLIIKFNEELSLPGKDDPAGYLDGYGVETKGHVAVVHGANGGLAVEAIRRGAKSIVVYEPRNQYFKALDTISGYCQTTQERTFAVTRAMPKLQVEGELAYDTIIWSEGLEQLQHPILPLKAVLSRLAPGGKLYIEVIHGPNGPCPALINSWKPKPESFEETIKAIADVKIVNSKKGRKDLRTVYTIESTKVAVPAPIVESFKADPPGPLADAAATPTVVTPKKQPKAETAPAAEKKPKAKRPPRNRAPRPPETPAGPTPTPV